MSAAFYFDVGSPYVYLAAERLERLGIEAEWKPISLGGLWKLTGGGSWALTERREAGIAEIEARAARYGLPPIRWPDPWPGHYLHAMRACLVAGEAGVLRDFARNALRMGFAEGRDLSGPAAIWHAALLSGLDPVQVNERIGAPEIKQRLIDETQAAHDRGVRGVPTLAVGERLHWGDDQLELAATACRLRVRFGAPAEAWWQRLPDLTDALAERWGLEIGDPVGRGNTSLVLRCRRAGGEAAVLKLTPDPELAGAEAAALGRWEGSGRVPLVWGADPALGALLLEAMPSELPLSERGGAVTVAEAAALIGALHAGGAPVVADGIVPLAERVEFVFEHWAERLPGAVPAERLQRGHDLARALAADEGTPVLLHGDLHPGNVLDGGAGRGLVAIDPRACVGDAAFDAVDWVFWEVEDPAAWEPRSRELASALGLEHERLWAWCAAFAALLAASAARRGAGSERVAALLALGPS